MTAAAAVVFVCTKTSDASRQIVPRTESSTTSVVFSAEALRRAAAILRAGHLYLYDFPEC